MSLPKYGVLPTPKYGQKCKFWRVTQNLRVFAYIARRYNSAAEATSLLSSVTSLAINGSFQNNVLLHNMLSKLVREDEDFPPRKKAKSGHCYAAE